MNSTQQDTHHSLCCCRHAMCASQRGVYALVCELLKYYQVVSTLCAQTGLHKQVSTPAAL